MPEKAATDARATEPGGVPSAGGQSGEDPTLGTGTGGGSPGISAAGPCHGDATAE